MWKLYLRANASIESSKNVTGRRPVIQRNSEILIARGYQSHDTDSVDTGAGAQEINFDSRIFIEVVGNLNASSHHSCAGVVTICSCLFHTPTL